MKRIIVLGGGFAGLETAIHLRKLKYDVTLVSDRDYFYIYPISIWIPTRETEFDDVCIPLKRLQQVHGSSRRKTYRHHLSILCVMDTGNGAAFVYRDDKRGVIFPLPIVGHWLKKAWGAYFKMSKLRKIPRIPGM